MAAHHWQGCEASPSDLYGAGGGALPLQRPTIAPVCGPAILHSVLSNCTELRGHKTGWWSSLRLRAVRKQSTDYRAEAAHSSQALLSKQLQFVVTLLELNDCKDELGATTADSSIQRN